MTELEQLIRSGRESRTLDYKGPCSWDESDKKACCELVKDAIALANSGGGCVVFGVAERSGRFQHDGLSEQELSSFDTTRVNRFLSNYCDPPINCTVAKVQLDGREFVVLEVPGFTEAPHICQKDYPGVLNKSFFYIRTANNESAPATSSSDFRRLIELAVRNQQDKLLESFRAILTGTQRIDQAVEAVRAFESELENLRPRALDATAYRDEYGDNYYRGFREAWAYPSRFDPKRLDLGTLRRIAERASIAFVGWPFLFFGQRSEDRPTATDNGLGWHGRQGDFAGQDRADFWHVGYSGLFLQRVLMWEESYARKNNTPLLLDVSSTAQYAAEALKCMTLLYDDVIAPEAPLTIGVRVYGASGRVLANIGPSAMPLWQRYEANVNIITYEETKPIAEWRAGLVEHAIQICRYVFERFNWENPNLNLCRSTIDRMFARKF